MRALETLHLMTKGQDIGHDDSGVFSSATQQFSRSQWTPTVSYAWNRHKSGIIHVEIVSEPRGQELSPTVLPPDSGTSHKSGLSPALLASQLYIGGAHDPFLGFG